MFFFLTLIVAVHDEKLDHTLRVKETGMLIVRNKVVLEMLLLRRRTYRVLHS